MSDPSSSDGYVSFRGSRRREFGKITHPRPVVFVDIDSEGPKGLRLPPAFVVERHATILFRSPEFLAGDGEVPHSVESSLEEWETVGVRVAKLVQPLGEPARVEVLSGTPLALQEEADLLARARGVELEALLELGQAIWRPTTFHYRLITGEHAGSYVKLGDALRQPRDAEALASWLHPSVEPGRGLIFDTGTLTPIVQALRLAACRAGREMGRVRMLDEYPRTVLDVGNAIDRVSGDPGLLTAVISVSSSGSLLSRVTEALASRGDSLQTDIQVMVDKSGQERPGIDAWTPTRDCPPLIPSGSRDKESCDLCKQAGRAVVVPINPFTFDAMLPTQLQPVVPDVDDPGDNRGLWEAAQRNGAISVERKAQEELRRFRSKRVPMGIKMEAQKLLRDEEFRAEVQKKLRHMKDLEGLSLDADLVLGPHHEVAKHEGYDEFWKAIRPDIAPDVERVTPFPGEERFPEDLVRQIREADSILVFQLGTVSGATIQRGLVGVQQAKDRLADFRLQAVVLHARPATSRELETLRNSYGHDGGKPQMHFAWSSILPDRSPLREERVALRKVRPEKLSDGAQNFLNERLELCNGKYEDSDPPAVLWGSKPESHLTPNAIYGKDLDSVTTYVAVGSAMSAALSKPRQMSPDFKVFEVAALARSYYDPLILGCMLRWMRPHEIFWGWTGEEAKTTALHILDRAETLGQEVLVPEMLLAAGEGKLTQEAAKVAVGVAERIQGEASTPPELKAILEVGLALARPDELPATAGIYPSPDAS